MAPTVPSSLLLAFFQHATSALNTCNQVTTDDSLSDIRKRLLQVQLDGLHHVVNSNNDNDERVVVVSAEQVQQALQKLGKTEQEGEGSEEENNNAEQKTIMNAMKEMNQAARLSFCRLVLRLECLHHQKGGRKLKTSGTMQRSDILEFFGLCNGAVKLDLVRENLRSGKPFFFDVPMPTPPSIFPQKRLEYMQRLFLQAVGYDPDFGTSEIKRIFFDPSTCGSKHEFSDDRELVQHFGELVMQMNAALNTASLEATHAQYFSDQHEPGGVTRVVSVHHSEKTIEPGSSSWRPGQSIGAPVGETMANGIDPQLLQQQQQQHQQARMQMARQAAVLQQEIMKELLSMDEATRATRLQQAKDASEDFTKRAMEIQVGPERMEFLRSVDPATQRLLATHKLWNHHQMMKNNNNNNKNGSGGNAGTTNSTTATTSIPTGK